MEVIVSGSSNPNYSVMIPCAPSEFSDFISGLLGKKQTISRTILGSFVVGHNELDSISDLLNQRISEQNESSLVQFTATVLYNDGSSVQHHSLKELRSYAEIKPVISIGVELSWIYLVKFRNKKSVERQQVDIHFSRVKIAERYKNEKDLFKKLILINLQSSEANNGVISLKIDHTSTTWGVDVDNLLCSHISSLIRKEKTINFIMRKTSSYILLLITIAVTVASFRIGHAYTESMKNDQFLSLKSTILELSSEGKIFDAIYEASKSIMMGRQDSGLVNLAFALAPAFVMFLYLTFNPLFITNIQPTSIKLSRESENDHDSRMKKYNRRSALTISSIITGIIIGFLGNIFTDTIKEILK